MLARVPAPRPHSVAIAAGSTQAGIAVTGSVVRVTGSGLGCPTWPQRGSGNHGGGRYSRHLPDLTFGDGPHACIGAQLAQLEARVLVDVLREVFPDAHLAVPFNELERDRSGQQSRLLASRPTWLRSG